jgi:hypothetical protein
MTEFDDVCLKSQFGIFPFCLMTYFWVDTSPDPLVVRQAFIIFHDSLCLIYLHFEKPAMQRLH